jgi:hypothetical protein
VCGLPLARQALPRPLLFQASALRATPLQESRKGAISAPALGRVAPLTMPEPKPEAVREIPPALPAADVSRVVQSLAPVPESSMESFWPLVRLEVTEACVLLGINVLLALLASWLVGATIPRLYGELWHFLLPIHVAVSWAFEMVPITLAGQSPVMGSLGLLLDATQPERRIAFSLFHLISVAVFPVSFLCMILTPYHRTLSEVLTGQEILMRPLPRMR